MRKVDVAIIGAGHAGRAAVEAVRRFGRNWMLIDQRPPSADCPGIGCLTSRGLIELAYRLSPGRCADDGCLLGKPTEQGRALHRVAVDWVDATQVQSVAGGERLIFGRARFKAPDLLDVEGEEIAARRVVVATGARARIPEGWDGLGSRLLTRDSLFEPQDLPASVAVIGLDAAGLELALALRRLGVQVTGFDSRRTIANIGDPEVNRIALEEVGRQIRVYPGAWPDVRAEGHRVRVTAGEVDLSADRLVVSIGRIPNVPDGLTDLCQTDRNGLPRLDRGTLQLGDLPIYVAGSASGVPGTPQESTDQGQLAGLNAVREIPIARPAGVPISVVSLAPDIAQVGARLSQAPDCVIGRRGFGPAGCDLITGRSRGLIRMYAERGTGQALGAAMIGPRVGHLARRLAWSIEQGHTVQQMLCLPSASSVLEEALHDALRQVHRRLRLVGSPRDRATSARRAVA